MNTEPNQASPEEMREHARNDAERYLCRPFSEWDDWPWSWLSASEPYMLEEALDVVRAANHPEAIGAIAMIAHKIGSEIRHSDPEKAAEYAAIVDEAVRDTTT